MDSEESVTSVGKKFTASQNNHQHTGKCPNGPFTEPVHILMSQNFSPLIRNCHHKKCGIYGCVICPLHFYWFMLIRQHFRSIKDEEKVNENKINWIFPYLLCSVWGHRSAQETENCAHMNFFLKLLFHVHIFCWGLCMKGECLNISTGRGQFVLLFSDFIALINQE